MKTDGCRERRESLGAYALGHLSDEERAGLEAHLEGCEACRAELEGLASLVRPMTLADPARFESAPSPPASLAARVAVAIGAEQLKERRRRRARFSLAFGGAAAVAAAVVVLLVLPGDEAAGPEQHVTFASLPGKMKISAKLIPDAFGTEIHMYVKGVSSGTLCRVYLRSRDGQTLSAGTFRYRWGEDSYPILSSALDLSKTTAMEIRVGDRTYEQEIRQ
jgi:predicted anti-sigma-YlaC factor YlaD